MGLVENLSRPTAKATERLFNNEKNIFTLAFTEPSFPGCLGSCSGLHYYSKDQAPKELSTQRNAEAKGGSALKFQADFAFEGDEWWEESVKIE